MHESMRWQIEPVEPNTTIVAPEADRDRLVWECLSAF